VSGKQQPRMSHQEHEHRLEAMNALNVLSQAAHVACVAVLMGEGTAQMTFRLDEIEDMVKKIRAMPGVREDSH
jgi:hypothetical protein